ncbi:unnamed protein product [Periconia digitata]|uniref:Ribonuclease H2 subunit B n=1 Tax=Periconia digitata TaxID=1303443 RepID=A0A9W4URI0_9PLEO|nr:unnamed protein product [Periconia digitata]
MARTRSKPAPAATTTEEQESTLESSSTTKSVPPSEANPPKLFLLPKDTSKDSRIVTLDNPATSAPSRYYFCPEKGFYEFTRIAAPKKDCRSWLVTSEESLSSNEAGEELNSDSKAELGTGYVLQTANFFIATPIDLLFLILPVLAPKNAKETEQHYLELFDHLEALSAASRQWKALLTQYPSLKVMVEKKLIAICDAVSMGGESMYRISQEKLLAILLKKAERVCKNGLPPSLENKFIKTALEVPIMNIKREESNLTVVSETTGSQLSTTTGADSQASTESPSTAATSVTHEEVVKEEITSSPSFVTPPEIPHLLRLRTALTYLTSSYLPSTIRTSINSFLQTSSLVDFEPLTAHLALVAKLRSEAAALRSISDNISRKRGLEEDDEKIAEREEKKRKKEEETLKKKNESRGIKQLKKVDTSGMKKMSSFFTKLPKKT